MKTIHGDDEYIPVCLISLSTRNSHGHIHDVLLFLDMCLFICVPSIKDM